MEKFTWLYIGSMNLWAVFAIILYFSKYADLKLGKPNDKPEYNSTYDEKQLEARMRVYETQQRWMRSRLEK